VKPLWRDHRRWDGQFRLTQTTEFSPHRPQSILPACVKGLGARSAELRDPAKAGGHHKAIRAKAEADFPGRKLSYLIGYGVYGLANSKL
jgi:hypothetical protein